MASEIGVQTIQHTNGTDAMTIGVGGIITQPKLPFFMVDLDTDQGSIPDNTATVIQFDDVASDPDSLWDTSNYRLTVDANTKGYWWVSVNIYINATNNIESTTVNIRKNGTDVVSNLGQLRASGGSGTSQTEGLFSFSAIMDLTTAGDYMDVTLKSDISSGGTTTVNRSGSTFRTYICGHRLR